MRPFRVDPRLLDFAREMRHDPAPSEQKLWRCLRDRKLNGHKFRRQAPLDKYVADFFCPASKLIVELDGLTHEDRQEHDESRTAELNAQGLDVIRFTNWDVRDNLEGVLLEILRHCESPAQKRSLVVGPSFLPSPLGTGERAGHRCPSPLPSPLYAGERAESKL